MDTEQGIAAELDAKKVKLLTTFAYETRMSEYKSSTRRGCSKTQRKAEAKAAKDLLVALLGRPATTEEIEKVIDGSI